MDRVKQFVLLLLAWAMIAPSALAADPIPQTTVKLLLSHEAARPGDTITAAIEVSSAPKWHTYWRNSGDSGMPTAIEWELPTGISAGAIQWPVPHKKELINFVSYVYEGTEYLLVPISIGTDTKPGTFEFKAHITWLECADICLMQNGIASQQVAIGNESKPSPSAAIIEKARSSLPRKNAPFQVTASWVAGLNAKKRTLTIEWTPEGEVNKPDFYPYEAGDYKVQPGTVVQTTTGKVQITKDVTIGDDANEWPTAIMGLVLNDSTSKEPVGYEVSLSPEGAATVSAPSATTSSSSATAASVSLWVALGFAFLGGLILNIMPCVLPVIALKILSFVNQSGAEPKRARRLGLVYGLGVLASFVALAGFLIAVQQAGGIASWGMQFQNPVFLVVMITLVTLIALNLFGVFEVALGGKAMGTASELASREGASGAFFNGVLATVLGTSCTAPFLAFAIGYALGQPPLAIILVFLTMGVGLAFPYVVLTWNPRLLRLLPKPGAWMERFKIAMGFPMLATAVWLYSVAVETHFGVHGALWLAMYLVVVALAAWVIGAFIQRGAARRGVATVFAAGALAFAIGFILERELNWRNPDYTRLSDGAAATTDGFRWEKWSHEAVAKARAAGRPVLVDFTASWCPNCQVNKRTSIEIDSVKQKLKDLNAVAMIGDFSRRDPIIGEELKKFERYAVPLVLVYSPDPNEPPKVLPPALTPNIVLEALDWAGKNKAQSASPSPQEKLAAKQ